METMTHTSTTEMEVTSIRLEKALKEKLKFLAGNQGYQALIREVLWSYIQEKSGEYTPQVSRDDIRATMPATAQREERCALTGKAIAPQDPMLLGFTVRGNIVPLTIDSIDSVL